MLGDSCVKTSDKRRGCLVAQYTVLRAHSDAERRAVLSIGILAHSDAERRAVLYIGILAHSGAERRAVLYIGILAHSGAER